MSEQTDLRRLLVLHGPALESKVGLEFLAAHFQIKMVKDLDQALAELRTNNFDAVLAETADFLPLERGIVSQQASVVLDTIGDGVCIVGPSGELVWANRRLRELPPDILEPLRKLCVQAYEQFAGGVRKLDERGKRFSLMPDDGRYFEVICSPVRDRAGQLRQIAAVVVNATVQRRQQLKLNAIDRAGRELVRLDRGAMGDAMQRLKLLEDRIIRYSRQVLDYQHFAVLLLDERTNKLNVVVAEGLDEEANKFETLASPEGNGICGYVAATGRSYICSDARKDPRYLVGLCDARSSLTVPLRLQDKIIGVLNVESDKEGAFGEEDRQFAEIFANYVAIALNMLNLLVFERHFTHTQLSGSISAELAGPLNDIISELTELTEDYIGQDDLRKRIGCALDTAHQARNLVKRLLEAPQTGVLIDGPGGGAAKSVVKEPLLVGKRILVVDDEELIRQTIRDVLGQYGCTVQIAGDGASAKEMIACCRYDLVISDIRMPGASGYEVFAAAKAACLDTKVILITGFGYDPHHSIVRANKEGLASVLMKPFKVKQLLDVCRSAFAPMS
jgi:CheY-like chemotaxis protein/PAS domain-containing protein